MRIICAGPSRNFVSPIRPTLSAGGPPVRGGAKTPNVSGWRAFFPVCAHGSRLIHARISRGTGDTRHFFAEFATKP